MITWFGIAQMVVGVLGAIICLVEYARKRGPNDYTLGASALLGLPPLGDPLEFWMYLIVALALPFGVGFWALVDRRRSANLVLIVMHLAVAVMVYRMLVIWG